MRDEEERFVFDNRSTETAPELIPFERRRIAGRMFEEVAGVERIVAEKFVQAAMERIPPERLMTVVVAPAVPPNSAGAVLVMIRNS